MITDPIIIGCSIINEPEEITYKKDPLTEKLSDFRIFRPGSIINYEFKFSNGAFLEYCVEKKVTPPLVSFAIQVVAESFCKDRSPWTLPQVRLLINKAIEVGNQS